MAQRNVSRREFLVGSAALGGITFLSSSVLGRAGQLPPSDKMNLAFIGIGTYGARGLRELASQNIVAVCDVDWRTEAQGATGNIASKVVQKYPQAQRFDDWRVMLEKLDKQIDGVVVASTDHTHAMASIMAMKMGKHVYCEKPLAHTVGEVRAMIAAADKYKVANQMGNQGHSSADCRNIVEWVRDGAIGTVREVHLFQLERSPDYYPQSLQDETEALKNLSEKPPVPPEVKWDLWLAGSPERPYHPMYLPRMWRSWQDFGCGILGDHWPHYHDPVEWALGLGYPETIQAETNPEWDPKRNKQRYPFNDLVHYTFPARGDRPAVNLTWHGFQKPPLPQGWKQGEELPLGGGIMVGSKGALVFGLMYQGRPNELVPKLVRLVPEELDREYRRPEKTLPQPKSHWLDWVEAAKAKKQSNSNFAYGGLLTNTALLGSIAIRNRGQMLRYDAKAGKFSNSSEANKMFEREYRKGWELPT
jgi:predicted dehydrogenase